MSQSSYAKIAGLQSEIGRVVITRVAGSELEYKRTLNMYRKDATCAVNNIRREQIKMRMKLARYVRKLKQTRIEHAKLIKEQQKHDRERALLEELHLRLKHEAAAKTPEPEEKPELLKPAGDEESMHEDDEETDDRDSILEYDGAPNIEIKNGAMFIQTGIIEGNDVTDRANHAKTGTRNRKPSLGFAPMLPMINEVAEKEVEEIAEECNSAGKKGEKELDRFDLKVWDDDISVSSYGGIIRKKKDVSFSDIIKLKYRGTKNLFDLVHRLAKKHGIQDVVEKVPDPRDSVVLRGSTDDSLRLQAAVLYPMKYGYNPEEDIENQEQERIFINSKSPVVDSEQDTLSDKKGVSPDFSEQSYRRIRRLSLKHSKSIDESETSSINFLDVPDQARKLKSRDLSMPELVDKVKRVKIEQADRLASSQKLENEMISAYNLLSPYKPSSSRSSRSLPAISKYAGKEENNVTWTQAFGILRAVHSLEDVSV